MVRFAVGYDGPIALRYPRGTAFEGYRAYRAPIEYGKSEWIHEESDIAVLSAGHMFEEAVKVWENLKAKGYNCSLINARFIKPIDEEMLIKAAKGHRMVAVMEENVRIGGYGEHILECVARMRLPLKVLMLALPDAYVEHGSIARLRKENGIDSEKMTEKILEAVKEL